MSRSEYNRQYYREHKEGMTIKNNIYYSENREKVLERQKQFRIDNNQKMKNRDKESWRKRTERERTKYNESRKIALEKLGNKCVRCGFNDPRALQIDHKNNDGYKQRKEMNVRKFHKILLTMATEELKNKYQLLCANCNWIKKHEKKWRGT